MREGIFPSLSCKCVILLKRAQDREENANGTSVDLGGKSGRDPGCPGSCHRGRGSGAEQIEDEDGT